MEMKSPPHPGELIGDSLEQLGMSISAAAKGLGITRQQLHNLIAGRSAVTPEMAVRFEKALGSTADDPQACAPIRCCCKKSIAFFPGPFYPVTSYHCPG